MTGTRKGTTESQAVKDGASLATTDGDKTPLFRRFNEESPLVAPGSPLGSRSARPHAADGIRWRSTDACVYGTRIDDIVVVMRPSFRMSFFASLIIHS
jgi:hypothetical protein